MAHPFKHFMTITRHRHLVMRYCFRAGIPRQGLLHDLSKYSPAEFLIGARYFTGHYSPNQEERRIFGYSSAWLHHKGRNRHHLEYWVDYNQLERRTAGVEMPMRFFVEMVCDRIAACRIYQGEGYTERSPYEYYLHSRHASLIHPETDRLLAETLLYLAEAGEEKLFIRLKQMVRAAAKAEALRKRTAKKEQRLKRQAERRRRRAVRQALKQGSDQRDSESSS